MDFVGSIEREAHLIATALEEAHVGLKDALAGRGNPADRDPTRLRPVIARCLQGVTDIAGTLGVPLPIGHAPLEFAGTENDVLGAYALMQRAVDRLARGLFPGRGDQGRLLVDAWLGLAFFARHHVKIGPDEMIRLSTDGLRDQLVSYVLKPAEGGMFPARSLAAHIAALAEALEATGAADAGVPVTALVQRVESMPDGAFAIDILCLRRRIQPPDPPRAATAAPPIYPPVDEREIVDLARGTF